MTGRCHAAGVSNGANNEPHRSLWLEEALAGREDAAPLEGPASADVAIIGGGYIGLWTALRLKQSSPDLDVVVLEADICGGGASGRNGGFALSWWAKLPSLVKLAGESGALQVCRESSDAVTELGEFASANGIDCDYRAGGWLWTARTDAQLGAWEGTVELAERLGADAFERLSPDEISRRAGSPQHLAGVLERTAATVQPAALVRGLRRVALEQGVRIHEHTVVRRIDRGGMRVETGGGSVEAGKIVIANNAWGASIRELRRLLVVVSSDIVATAPIPERLAEIGWTGGECITDCQQMIDYYRTTRGRADRLRQGRLADRLRRPHPRRIRRGRAARASWSSTTCGWPTPSWPTSRSRTAGRARSTARRPACRCSGTLAATRTSCTASAGAATASRRR